MSLATLCLDPPVVGLNGIGVTSAGVDATDVDDSSLTAGVLDKKSGGRGASEAFVGVCRAVYGEHEDPEEEESLNANGKVVLLVVSGGRGASGMSFRFSLLSSSVLTLGVPKMLDFVPDPNKPVPKRLEDPEAEGFVPKRLDPVVDVDLKSNFWGAGVAVGVVDSVSKMDWAFS